MRHIAIPLTAATAALLAACSASAGDTEGRPSGVQGTRSFAATGFDAVELAGPDNVIVQVGKAASVSAVGDTGVLDRLDIEVKGGTLHIGRKRTNGVGINFGRTRAATITVTLPAITGASVAGSGDMSVDKVASPKFGASVAGSGSLAVAAVQADALDVSIAGSGGVSLASGMAGAADYSIAGSGGVDGAGFASKTADISIAGSGNVKVGVAEQADVSIIGSGNVDIVGGAKCKVSKMGSGEVRCPSPAPR